MITYYLQFSEWKGMIGILGRNIPEAQCEAEADLWTVQCTAEAEWRGGEGTVQ